ncbi:MAG: hypothetical protein QM775_33090 [Pirellulales bacterium]
MQTMSTRRIDLTFVLDDPEVCFAVHLDNQTNPAPLNFVSLRSSVPGLRTFVPLPMCERSGSFVASCGAPVLRRSAVKQGSQSGDRRSLFRC